MKRLVALLLALLASSAFALDPIWNMHYTFGPDSKHTTKFNLGAGVKSYFNNNILIPVNFIGSVSKDFEIGGKLDVYTYDEMKHSQLTFDVGGKYYLNSTSFLEVDGYFGLNRNNASAVVATYGFEKFIAKNFSSFYELRAGFLDGVTGEDGYVKFSSSMIPTLYFGKPFRTMIEIIMSESAGNLQDDFMIDIIPKFELSLGSIRLRLDFDLGIMQEKNNDQKTIALYAMMAL